MRHPKIKVYLRLKPRESESICQSLDPQNFPQVLSPEEYPQIQKKNAFYQKQKRNTATRKNRSRKFNKTLGEILF